MTDIGSISLSGIISSVLFGIIGMWMFREGKKNTNHSVLIIGILLMAYPYFTSGPIGDWGIGILLCAIAYNVW